MRSAIIAVVALISAAVLVTFIGKPDSRYVFTGTDPGCAPTTRPAGSIYLEPFVNGKWIVVSAGGVRSLPDGVRGEPSRLLHNGTRWFLTTRTLPGESYPHGSPRQEVFCVSEDGRACQLTDQPDLEPAPFAARWPAHGQDLRISWIARRLSPDGQVKEGGVYSALLLLNERGEPTGLAAQPQAPMMKVKLVSDSGFPGWAPPVPDVCGHDWSPDGKQIVIESGHHELRVGIPATGEWRVLVPEIGCDPSWAPDGSVIAYKEIEIYGAITVVRPDGSGRRQILTGAPGDCIVGRPVFGPGGDRLAHMRVHWLSDPATTVTDTIVAWITSLGTGKDWVLEAPGGYLPVAWRETSVPAIRPS